MSKTIGWMALGGLAFILVGIFVFGDFILQALEWLSNYEGYLLVELLLLLPVLVLIYGIIAFFRGRRLKRMYEQLQEETTQHQKTQQALAQREAQFRTLTQSAPVGIFLNDAEGECVYANPKWIEIVGWRDEECLESDWMATIHPSDRDRVILGWAEAVARGKMFHEEYRWAHKDGQTVHSLCIAVPVKDEDGKVKSFVGTLIDLTEVKKAEKDLQEKATLLKSISDAVIHTDLNFTIRSWNSAAEKLYGWKEEEVLGKELGEAIPTTFPFDDPDNVIAQFRQAGIWQGEAVQRHKDGRDINVLVSVTVVLDERGQPISAIAIHHDITERKKAEEELRQQATLLQSISDAVIHTDLDFTIRSWNSAAEELYGFKAAEVVGRKMNEMVASSFPHTTREAVVEEFNMKGVWAGDAIQRHKDGHYVHFGHPPV